MLTRIGVTRSTVNFLFSNIQSVWKYRCVHMTKRHAEVTTVKPETKVPMACAGGKYFAKTRPKPTMETWVPMRRKRTEGKKERGWKEERRKERRKEKRLSQSSLKYLKTNKPMKQKTLTNRTNPCKPCSLCSKDTAGNTILVNDGCILIIWKIIWKMIHICTSAVVVL